MRSPYEEDENQPVDGPADLPPQAPPAPTPDAPSVVKSPFNREQFRDAWMGTGTNVDAQNQLLAQNGLTADGAGRFTLPTGEVIDGRIGARAGINQAAWTGVGPTAGPGGAEAGGSGWGSTSGSLGAGTAGGFQSAARDALMRILQQAQQPVDANSEPIKAQMDAAGIDAQRQLEGEQKALAEAQYAQGRGSSSNELMQGIQQSRERVAGSLAGLRGQLMARAAEQRMGQLQQALSLAVQSGDSEAARDLQWRIAQVQADLSRSGLALQSQRLAQDQSQFNDQFGLSAAQFRYLQDRDLVNAAQSNAGE